MMDIRSEKKLPENIDDFENSRYDKQPNIGKQLSDIFNQKEIPESVKNMLCLDIADYNGVYQIDQDEKSFEKWGESYRIVETGVDGTYVSMVQSDTITPKTVLLAGSTAMEGQVIELTSALSEFTDPRFRRFNIPDPDGKFQELAGMKVDRVTVTIKIDPEGKATTEIKPAEKEENKS